MFLKKEDFQNEILPNTYLINFDSELKNYDCFVNFESINAVKEFIESKTILKLYNDFLDFICNSCYVCEDEAEAKAHGYQIIKVIDVAGDMLEVEIVEDSLGN